jgi:type I restriction enzyme M protein
MTSDQLRKLESELWSAADQLRANSKLTATEYSFPVLGLIFLRHAFNRYTAAKAEIEETLPVHAQRGRRAVTKDDFLQAKAIFLPDKAQWKYIAELPEGRDIGKVIDDAMRAIEGEYEVLEGVLPKNYSVFEKELLQRLVRIFNTETLDSVTGDVFGRIYEFFLNKFAMSGAQEGGEFFTPPSLVNAIVNVIEPDRGIVLDCACGSAGMFVQTGHFIEEEGFEPSSKVTFYGQEKTETNTKLAKMNMTVHGLDAKILQGNSFYEDQHDLVGKCDFVMANPPFNVDGVDKERDYVKNDPRLPFGLPRNDNANYLWIQYFYGYLNETGRAGFVMASSASDAGHSEREIRKQIVETGAVDVMIAIGTKFFYTRSLPCTLWFYDRGKENDPDKSDQTLMLDLRDVFRKVSSSVHDFTDEQLMNLHAIIGLYRGNSEHWHEAFAHHQGNSLGALAEAQYMLEQFHELTGASFPHERNSVEHVASNRREMLNIMKTVISNTKEDAKAMTGSAAEVTKTKITELERIQSIFSEASESTAYFHKSFTWLTSRFPDGEYADVAGLCKIVARDDIAANDYSLTPGRYVGVASQIDEDFDYEERMADIKAELQGLNGEAIKLAQRIQENLTELGL